MRWLIDLRAEYQRADVLRAMAQAAIEDGDFTAAKAAMDRWEASMDRQELILREPEMLKGTR